MSVVMMVTSARKVSVMIIDPHFALRIHHQRIADSRERARRRPVADV